MKVTEIKLPFGLNQDNTLIHIAEIESGKCSLICPSCSSPLTAVKGSKNQHHFRHTVIKDCEGGLESAIHLAAKQIIKEKMYITLPECVSTASKIDSKGKNHTEQETVTQNGTVISFDSVQDEIELHEMKADILATKSGKPLIIEIFYRHRVDVQKLEKIIKANLSAIEINLSDLKPEDVRDWEAFWACINDPARIQWLNNARATYYNQILKTRLEQEEIAKQKIEQKRLLQALKNIKLLSSKEYIAQLNQEAQFHPDWKHHSQYIPFAWDELPDFLNVSVSNGDWIFGCDRRIWQMAVYSFFLCRGAIVFTTKRAYDWLKNEGLKVSFSVKIIDKYYRKYPELVPADISDNIPLAWKALHDYFNYLCKLGMLKFSEESNDNYWVILSKNPR